MYSIYSDGICIHSDRALTKDFKVLNPKLTLTDNAAGSLEITIPPCNAGYNIVKRTTSEISVVRDNDEIWSGRIITEREDFWKRRVLTCEGELAYLNDSTQPQKEYKDITISEFMEEIITIHNTNPSFPKWIKPPNTEDMYMSGAIVEHNDKFWISDIDDNFYEPGQAEWSEFFVNIKKFEIGTVTFDKNLTLSTYTNYETTLECINENLVKKFGGHIRIRKENGKRYIDYFKDYVNTNTQIIRFGENLLDFVKNWDMASLHTAILPRGASVDESTIEGLEAYLTVESVNAGSPYVTSEEAIKEYGWIEKVVDFEDVTDASTLLAKTKEYITDTQFEEMIIELSAVDLHYYAREVESIKLLDQVRCISTPHGMDRYFPVSQLIIPLDNPGNATYTLGASIHTSLTSTNKNTNSDILRKLEVTPNNPLLKAAKKNATDIMNIATNGFVTITKSETGSEALIISDTEDYTVATKYWKWNINGLAYYGPNPKYEYDENGNLVRDENDEPQLKLAITMDGSIVADYITTGTLNAGVIKAGLLMDGQTEEESNVIFNLDEGVLTIKQGSIHLGEKDATGHNPFEVDEYGCLYAIDGNIGGFTITEDSIYNNVISLTNDGVWLNREDVKVGKIGSNNWTDHEDYVGLTFDLENDASYMSWAVREYSTDDHYTVKLLYTKESLNDGEKYKSDRLNICCESDFHKWAVYNCWLDPNSSGVNRGLTTDGESIRLGIVDSTGIVTGYIDVIIQNGFILPG